MLVQLSRNIVSWLRAKGNEKGATAVEYGLIVALIAVVIIIAVALLGTNLRDLFDQIAGYIGDPSSVPTE